MVFRALARIAHPETLADLHIEQVYCVFMPAVYFVRFHCMRILFGIDLTNALPALLFSDVTMMPLRGFNADSIEHEMTQRGVPARNRTS